MGYYVRVFNGLSLVKATAANAAASHIFLSGIAGTALEEGSFNKDINLPFGFKLQTFEAIDGDTGITDYLNLFAIEINRCRCGQTL